MLTRPTGKVGSSWKLRGGRGQEGRRPGPVRKHKLQSKNVKMDVNAHHYSLCSSSSSSGDLIRETRKLESGSLELRLSNLT